MRKTVVMLLLLVSVFSLTVRVSAQEFFAYENPDDRDEMIRTPIDPAHYIGTVRFCVEESQRLPDEINSAICDGDDEAYNAKMAELASNIAQATSAMADAGIPNTLNLWNVYGILKTKECGSGAAATSHADWAREELDRVSFRIGVIDPARMCGSIPFGMPLSMADPTLFQLCSADIGAANCSKLVAFCDHGNEPYWVYKK